ncbi:MAG: cellulase family glycosylhydrolase [Thermoguttaceae bacterium]
MNVRCILHSLRWTAGLTLVPILTAVIAPLPAAEKPAETAPAAARPMERVRISQDGKGFVLDPSGAAFTPWGFNFVGRFGRIVEEYWQDDWASVEKDFRQMRSLGANVVRLHLQVGTYMKTAEEVDEAALIRLRRLLDLGRDTGLYLDLTGLGCYHLAAIPPWLDKLSEQDRWQVQARFWEAIARTCSGHPALFCYDLVNEPVIGQAMEGEHPWLLGEMEGFYFVQRIANDPAGRTSEAIAEAWVSRMVEAIRKHDRDTLVTVGVIPWAQIFPGAKPLFYAPPVARHLDFVSVHFYPQAGKVAETLTALAVYDIGKPLVVEETFPLSCSLEEMDQFIDGARPRVEGWISHYFGHSIEEHAAGAEPSGELVAKFLEYWKEKGHKIQAPQP